jgi:outer membrane biosynthesis protein TonB
MSRILFYRFILVLIILTISSYCLANTKDSNDIDSNENVSITKDEYMTEVARAKSKNWKFPESVASILSPNAKTSILFTIVRSGEIKDIIILKESGLELLDRTAYEAVNSSSPVKPIPSPILDDSIMMGLNFSPGGIK